MRRWLVIVSSVLMSGIVWLDYGFVLGITVALLFFIIDILRRAIDNLNRHLSVQYELIRKILDEN